MVDVNIFVAEYPFKIESDIIFPEERAEEIESCNDKSIAESKFYVWKLLEYAVNKTFGLNFCNLKFFKDRNGKWKCENFEFSLSHSGKVVAVALSDKPVGIDVELKNAVRFEKLKNKILTESENERISLIPENRRGEEINKLWTVKEAAFKMQGGGAFIPSLIETVGIKFFNSNFQADGGEYFVTVANCERMNIKFYEV